MSLQHGSDNQKPKTTPQPKVCGSIIDAQGREVPITEQMIQQACKALEESRGERVRKG
ncbi:PA1571 family protein [Pseudomonas sp. NPDC090592]|uniref:PA1571 family protein n=1 Tax=Pseudomonas sp. NPDC090592 TaxID=3364480 RepID=UPI00383BBC88